MDKESFWNYIMLIGLVSIIFSGGLAFYEFRGAERYCDSIDGDYKFTITPLPPEHKCNGEILIQYKEGWEIESERVNLNNFKVEFP